VRQRLIYFCFVADLFIVIQLVWLLCTRRHKEYMYQ